MLVVCVCVCVRERERESIWVTFFLGLLYFAFVAHTVEEIEQA